MKKIVFAIALLATPAMANDAATYSEKDRAAMTKLVKSIEADAKRASLPDVIKSAWDAAVETEIKRRSKLCR